jgi:glutathionyl-hydroquinone reductase
MNANVFISLHLAHRVLIVRKLKGLEEILPITSVHYHMSITKGWRFVTSDEDLPGEGSTPDPLHNGTERLREIYFKAQPDYSGRFTVPVLWDKKLNTIVNNESSEIIRMMYTEFDDLMPPKYRNTDLYPENLRSRIDETNAWTYDNINNGV